MSRPNILLILLDQWRYDALGANGGTPCRTPNLDRLASEGMRHTRAYTPCAICTPARASLLTGLYPHAHGMLNNCHEEDAILPELPNTLPTFSQELRRAGYGMGYVGKWHIGRERGPESRGFEHVGGTLPAYAQYRLSHGLPALPNIPVDAINADSGRMRLLISGTDETPAEHSYSAYLVEESMRILDVMAGEDDPFFLQVSFEGPHHPYLVPEPYASWYDPDDLEPWPSFADTFENKPAIHEIHMRHRGVDGWTWQQWAPVVAKYFGFVGHLDAEIGRLLDWVRDRRLDENTLVVVSTDHGDFTGSHRQFNKGPLMYEDTYHIPMLVRWPEGGVEPGSTCDEFVRLLDLGPTFLSAAGIEQEWECHGRDLLPLWREEPVTDWPETVYAEFHGDEWGLYSQRMVREPQYKFVYNAQDIPELYDLSSDPAELTNLAELPALQTVRRRLEGITRRWMLDTNDPLHQWASLLLGEN